MIAATCRLPVLVLVILCGSYSARGNDPAWFVKARQQAKDGQLDQAIATVDGAVQDAQKELNRFLGQLPQNDPGRLSDEQQEHELLAYVDQQYAPTMHLALNLACHWVKTYSPKAEALLEESARWRQLLEFATGWAVNIKGVAREVISDRLRNGTAKPLAFKPRTIADIRRAIRDRYPRAVLIEYIAYKGRDLDVKDSPFKGRFAVLAAGAKTESLILDDIDDKTDVTALAKELHQGMLAIDPEKLSDSEWKKLSATLARLKKPLLHDWPERLAASGANKAGTGAPRLILSPAADMWLIPFTAMRLGNGDKGRYAIQDLSITYAVTSRDIVRRSESSFYGTKEPQAPAVPVVIAGPDYDAASPSAGTSPRGEKTTWFVDFAWPADVKVQMGTSLACWKRHRKCGEDECLPFAPPATTPRLTPSPEKRIPGADLLGSEVASTARKPWGRKVNLRRPSAQTIYTLSTFDDSPDTRPLGQECADLLGVTLHKDAQATERLVSSLVSPRQLVICTHGFAPGLPSSKEEFLNRLVKSPDPLMRCGIALAGVNRRPFLLPVRLGTVDLEKLGPESIVAGEYDGLLLGREVVARCHLEGTELVTLVSCLTGQGDPLRAENAVAGDGLATVRHAFLRAGAKAVVAGTWQVPLISGQPKDPTTRIIKGLFEELKKRNQKLPGRRLTLDDIEESLREAQLEVLRNPGPAQFAYPYYWAVFSVTGQ